MAQEPDIEAEGGPFFPEPFGVKGNLLVKARVAHVHPGISLRDYFAAQSLLGLLAAGRGAGADGAPTARDAYRYADLMLKEKSEKKMRLRKDFD